ncbi:alpha/beta-hydrolase [Trametes meyenii]|nr:alpha/beta-hydrolase [Trametes meyenii]
MAPIVTDSEQPFTLSIPQSHLDLLKKKLELVRFPDELDDAGWSYGVPLSHMQRLVTHWKDRFDWRAAEADINLLSMFTRNVTVDTFGTLNIHYVHQRSEVSNAIPLLFVHGWPGHFLEARKLLPYLSAASPVHPSFHIVAANLPGFGFSEAPTRPGFATRQYAEVLNKLMLALGYEEYVYQGGDWGHAIGHHIATIYGHKHLKAWHSNLPIPTKPTLFAHPLAFLRDLFPYSKATREGLGRTAEYRAKGMGYLAEQSTKPQTIGYPIADSPVGLLAWIYEKLVEWSDSYPWTDDEVLEWVSIYWFSRAGPAASLRIYYEMAGGSSGLEKSAAKGAKWTSVPLGLSYFPQELFHLPKWWAPTLGNVVYAEQHDEGGHFAAYEQPEALAEDLRRMFGRRGPAYGIVHGKDGYE